MFFVFFFFQAEDGIRDKLVTGVQTCALPISIEPDADCCTLFVPAHPATRMSEAEVRAVEARLDIPRLVAQGTAGAVTATLEVPVRGPVAGAPGGEPPRDGGRPPPEPSPAQPCGSRARA